MDRSKVLKFSKQELKFLLKSRDSFVSIKRVIRVILLPPIHLSDVKQGINTVLAGILLKYDGQLKATALGFDRIKILRESGVICLDGRVAVKIEADFYVFETKVGNKLRGKVSDKLKGKLKCTIHRDITAYVDYDDGGSNSEDFSHSEEVTFTVTEVRLVDGRAPYIRGQLFTKNNCCHVGDSSRKIIEDVSVTICGSSTAVQNSRGPINISEKQETESSVKVKAEHKTQPLTTASDCSSQSHSLIATAGQSQSFGSKRKNLSDDLENPVWAINLPRPLPSCEVNKSKRKGKTDATSQEMKKFKQKKVKK